MSEHMPVRGLRHAFRTEVEIGWGAEVLKCVTRDIGDMGMFIETEDPLWLRAEFTARDETGRSPRNRLHRASRRAGQGHGRGIQGFARSRARTN